MEKNKTKPVANTSKWKPISIVLMIVLAAFIVLTAMELTKIGPIRADERQLQAQITEMEQKRDELKEKVMLAQLPKHND